MRTSMRPDAHLNAHLMRTCVKLLVRELRKVRTSTGNQVRI